MKILIAEDTEEKARHVVARLKEWIGGACSIVQTDSGIAALRLASQESFDLYVLDVVLPWMSGSIPSVESGVNLIKRLRLNRATQQVPIVVLSIYEEALEAISGASVSLNDVTLVRYDSISNDWEGVLEANIRRAAAEATHEDLPGGRPHNCMAVVLTAVEDIELPAVLACFSDSVIEPVTDDATQYYRGSVSNGDVYMTCAAEMGLSAAAIAATKATVHFRPRFLAMSGITGGIRGKVEIGDIILAHPAWNWGSGKWKLDGTAEVFHPSPRQLEVDVDIVAQIRRILSPSILANIAAKWPSVRPRHDPRLFVGPSASGAAVVAHSNTLTGILNQHRDVIGVEMEAYGVYLASREAARPRPRSFCLKAVSDFADETKDDAMCRYAAFVSANAVKIILENLTV